MDIKTFLENDKLINKSELARLMYPGKATPVSRLNNKVKEVPAGKGSKQRLTDEDKRAAFEVLDDLVKAIQAIDRGLGSTKVL